MEVIMRTQVTIGQYQFWELWARYLRDMSMDYLWFLNDLKLITACQFDLRKCHSMATTLVKIYDDFLKGFDTGHFVGAVLIDLQKAFNK